MVRQCQVCKKSTHLNPEVSFHKFPTDLEARKLWFSLVGIKKGQWLPKLPEICSDHFDQSDIHTKANGLRYVNPGATPQSRRTVILDSSSCSEDESTSTYSEELYKTLLKQHKLDDKNCREEQDSLAVGEEKDSLAVAKLSDNECIQEESSKNKAFIVLEIKSEPRPGLQVEERAPDGRMEYQTEVIKIEIVNDETGSSDDECPPPTKKAIFVEDASTKSKVSSTSIKNKVGRSLREGRVQRRIPQKYNDGTRQMNVSDSECQRIEPSLSLKDLSSFELDFNCNFNVNATSNDERIISFTSVQNDILDVCEKCMENTLYRAGISEIKNIRPKIVLVLMKLRTNLPFKILAMMLGLRHDICAKIFYSVADLLFVSLKSAVCWFTGNELTSGKEKCFTDYYDRVRVILFKLVFKVNKCQDSRCNVQLCQQYKKHQAVQVLVGLSPKRNLFSYVTDTYDSKLTIDAVLKKERLLSHLCARGDIVCLTGNHVEYSLLLKDCQKQGIVLRIVRDMKREVQDYADNTFRQLSEFEIIGYREIDSHMVPFVGKAVGVICGVLNLRFEAEYADETLQDIDTTG